MSRSTALRDGYYFITQPVLELSLRCTDLVLPTAHANPVTVVHGKWSVFSFSFSVISVPLI